MTRSTEGSEETLAPVVREALKGLYFGSLKSFYKAYLDSKMTRYQFDSAVSGRPVAKKLVEAIVEAYVKDTDRVFRILVDADVPKFFVEYVKEKYGG